MNKYQGACACLIVKYLPILHQDNSYSENWECDSCGREFVKKPKKRFAPPSLEEITQYVKEKGYKDFSSESFFNYYESIGWKVGKNVMKNWKAALSGWVSRNNKTTEGQTKESYTYAEVLELTNSTCNGYEIIEGTRTWKKI